MDIKLRAGAVGDVQENDIPVRDEHPLNIYAAAKVSVNAVSTISGASTNDVQFSNILAKEKYDMLEADTTGFVAHVNFEQPLNIELYPSLCIVALNRFI